MHRRWTTILGLAVLSGMAGRANPVMAQSDGPSVLALLPASGTVSMGQELDGRLGRDDYLSGGRRVQRHDFEGVQGDPIIVDLISEDFDAYLIVVGPGGTELATDDDGGGACHARISMFLEETGTFGIVAASLSGETGAFTLRLDNRQGPPVPGDCGGLGGDVLDAITSLEPQGSVSLDGPSEVEGQLDSTDRVADGRPAEAWLLSGTPGQRVVVDLASTAFDTMLFVVEPGRSDYDQDDDSGGACNSRIEVVLADEPHMLVVRSFDPGASGPFTIRVSEEAAPTADGECPGFP